MNRTFIWLKLRGSASSGALWKVWKSRTKQFFSIETFMHEQVLTITLARSRSTPYCCVLADIPVLSIIVFWGGNCNHYYTWRLSSLILTMEVGKTSMQQSSQSWNFKTDLWYFGLFGLSLHAEYHFRDLFVAYSKIWDVTHRSVQLKKPIGCNNIHTWSLFSCQMQRIYRSSIVIVFTFDFHFLPYRFVRMCVGEIKALRAIYHNFNLKRTHVTTVG